MATDSEHRKALKRAYKERPKPAGVFRITNTVTGKVLLGSSLNLDGVLNRHRFMLSLGSHHIAAMQDDWRRHGAASFVFELLETVEVKQDPSFNVEDELTLLEELWLEKLGPLGDRSYGKGMRIRQV
jgi:hypothetical protein